MSLHGAQTNDINETLVENIIKSLSNYNSPQALINHLNFCSLIGKGEKNRILLQLAAEQNFAILPYIIRVWSNELLTENIECAVDIAIFSDACNHKIKNLLLSVSANRITVNCQLYYFKKCMDFLLARELAMIFPAVAQAQAHDHTTIPSILMLHYWLNDNPVNQRKRVHEGMDPDAKCCKLTEKDEHEEDQLDYTVAMDLNPHEEVPYPIDNDGDVNMVDTDKPENSEVPIKSKMCQKMRKF